MNIYLIVLLVLVPLYECDDKSFTKSFRKTNLATELTVCFVYYEDASQHGVSNMRLVDDEFWCFQVNDIIVKK